jgi:hypothetical protein
LTDIHPSAEETKMCIPCTPSEEFILAVGNSSDDKSLLTVSDVVITDKDGFLPDSKNLQLLCLL